MVFHGSSLEFQTSRPVSSRVENSPCSPRFPLMFLRGGYSAVSVQICTWVFKCSNWLELGGARTHKKNEIHPDFLCFFLGGKWRQFQPQTFACSHIGQSWRNHFQFLSSSGSTWPRRRMPHTVPKGMKGSVSWNKNCMRHWFIPMEEFTWPERGVWCAIEPCEPKKTERSSKRFWKLVILKKKVQIPDFGPSGCFKILWKL